MAPLYKVQDGVPMPAIDRTSKSPRRKFPVETMRPGQMFFVPDKKTRSVSAYISRITKDLPGKFSARKAVMCETIGRDGGVEWKLCDPGDPGATEGVGVWRIE